MHRTLHLHGCRGWANVTDSDEEDNDEPDDDGNEDDEDDAEESVN